MGKTNRKQKTEDRQKKRGMFQREKRSNVKNELNMLKRR